MQVIRTSSCPTVVCEVPLHHSPFPLSIHCRLCLCGWECVSAAALCEAADSSALGSSLYCPLRSSHWSAWYKGSGKSSSLLLYCITGVTCITQIWWCSHSHTVNRYVRKKNIFSSAHLHSLFVSENNRAVEYWKHKQTQIKNLLLRNNYRLVPISTLFIFQ